MLEGSPDHAESGTSHLGLKMMSQDEDLGIWLSAGN